MEISLYIIIAYFLGSIPTAVWIGKSKFGIDIREQGSKNAGATNTFRVLGKRAGIIVLSIDIVKGLVAVLIPFISGYSDWRSDALINIQLTCGIIAVAGHIFPLFAKFKGGKGVATSLGIILGIHPQAASICILIFLAFFIISNFVSLAAIAASLSFPILVHLLFDNNNTYLSVFSVLLSFAVIIAHHKNIKRLMKGEENKMNLFKK
ncbi:MAG: glycerol-3-phosphate 1-O-acyltransferase PlsY [Crocinitomicaceae bacterium]|jgi:glycerol-3-phosphate acyltransferase PlsY|nr:glycerol-3-phosphate 1-O-acyltransferase PlsY [Crocinitomicaceae bacterium]